jgi:hypothetical protein
MSEDQLKPLNWTAAPGIGYTASRRPDGGLYLRFTSLDHATLQHWREFALQHLLDSDRLTRNLYDLRPLETVTDEAVSYAVEVNTDPSVRNIRLAVVVSSEQVGQAVHRIAALSGASGVEMAVFHELEAAEAWLDRPLTILV